MFNCKWRVPWKKVFFVLIVVLVVVGIVIWDPTLFMRFSENETNTNTNTNNNNKNDEEEDDEDDFFIERKKHNLKCFEFPGNRLYQLDEREPELGKSIFFHETSCPQDMTDVPLNARQACSVETALRAHPDNDVFLLISSPIFKTLEEIDNLLVSELLSYPNFKLRHIKFSEYLANTPLEVIYNSGALNDSLYPMAHSSDVLRYATLYKFGGVYLDLDVMVLRPLLDIQSFAGAESNYFIGSGIIGLGSDYIGREVAKKCVEDLARSYNGKIWGFNGPGVITRVLQDVCGTQYVGSMFKRRCNGFKVFPTYYLSALSYNNPEFFFTEGNTLKAEKILNQSLVVHYWNKLSSQFKLNDNTLDIPFLKYAQKYCPKVYEAADGYF